MSLSDCFRILVDTTKAGSAADTFVLPLNPALTYAFWADWGDGVQEFVDNATVGFPNITHVYPAPGTYVINIEPTLILTGKVSRGSTIINNGGTDTVTGTTANTPTTLSYVLTNNAAVLLTASDVAVDNLINCTATVSENVLVSQPAVEQLGTTATRSTVEPDQKNTPVSGTSTFVVTVTPSAPGVWSFDIGTPTNIQGANPYIWSVTGTAS